jgi:hypothetical protein
MRKWLILGLILPLLVSCNLDDWSNRLPYAGPVEIGIDRGESLPGTNIQYLGKTEDGAQVSIGGKQALKKIGDSLDWKGDVLGNVTLDQTYRVAFIAEDTLHVAGTTRVIIPNPKPQAEAANKSASIHFKFPAGYHVEKDEAIPGSVITYLGKTEQGARLGNIEGYEYRKVGDSIAWEGKLRERIWIELNLRTALVTDSTLDVVGTVDVWIAP